MQLKTLANNVIAETPGIPTPIAVSVLREAINIFCAKSTVWREEASYSFLDGLYTIAPPVGTRIVTVISPIDVDGESVQGYGREYQAVRTGYKSRFFVMQSDNSFILYSRLNAVIEDEKEIVAHIALKLNRIATEIDDVIGERWYDEIASGAKWLAMFMPNQPWSNPELAGYYKMKFDEGIKAAKAYIESGYRQPLSDGKRHVKGYFK